MTESSFQALRVLVVKCFNFAPYKTMATLGLMLFSSFTSGVGLLMIVPLMTSVGVELGNTGAATGFAENIAGLFKTLGIGLDLETVLVVYIVLIIIMAITSYSNSVLSASLQRSFVLNLRSSMSRALFYTKWKFLNRSHMSDFMRLLTGQIQTTSATLYVLLSLVSGVILVIVYLAFSLLLSVEMTLLALLFGLVLIAINWPLTKQIRSSGETQLKANRAVHRAIFENLSSLKAIKSYSAEEKYLAYLESANKSAEVQQLRIARFGASTRFLNTVVAAVTFAAVFYCSIRWFNVPLANLLALLFIFSRLMPQVSSIQNNVQNLIHRAPSYLDLLNRMNELAEWAEQPRAQQAELKLEKSISLVNVGYKYLDGIEPAFASINAKITRKQTVAIVGPSGVGKSTLADILAGLVAPTEGKILIDNQPLNESNRMAWRQRVAYVTQDVFLFHDSVRDNLSWVCKPEDRQLSDDLDKRIWAALELAAADEFVRKLPYGLDTEIGDRGVKLSGGERQRLSLARALLSSPDLLILDEATSSLDRENEIKIRDSLRELDGKLTIIVIAHNETTIEHVSQRIELS